MHPIIDKLVEIKKEAESLGHGEALIRLELKEFLQNHILYALYTHEEFKNLIFYGGTCLRKIFSLNRMSEDLDFESLVEVDLDKLGKYLKNYFVGLKLEDVEYKVQKSENISRVTMKFSFLFNLGLSEHDNEKLHVKVKINQISGKKFETELTPLMRSSLSMLITHYTLERIFQKKVTRRNNDFPYYHNIYDNQECCKNIAIVGMYLYVKYLTGK